MLRGKSPRVKHQSRVHCAPLQELTAGRLVSTPPRAVKHFPDIFTLCLAWYYKLVSVEIDAPNSCATWVRVETDQVNQQRVKNSE